MRQAYQNKRARGRSRKGPNPLSKTYESNGPDVKIRGTAAHIAEKYASLARDAQSSGDPIQAENYMQHAEHYLRIIAAAQPPQQPSHNDQRADMDEDAVDGEEVAADTGENQDRRRNQGRNNRQRRQPYRNGMNNGAEDTSVAVGDAPQPYVDAMLPKPANSAINGASDEQETSEVASAEAGIRTIDLTQDETPAASATDGTVEASETVVEATTEQESPAPRRRGRPPKRRPADEADGEAEPRPPRRRGRPPKAKPVDADGAEA